MLCNRDRAVRYMREAGIDAIIATTPPIIGYFSDYNWPLDMSMREYMFRPEASSEYNFPGFVVFPVEGEPTFILGTRFALNSQSWIQDVRLFGTNFDFDLSLTPKDLDERVARIISGNPYPRAIDALREVLHERGLMTGKRIGIELDGLGAERVATLHRELKGATLLDCTKLIRLVRMVKTPAEIDRLRTAITITEKAATEAIAEARPGCTLESIERSYRVRLAQQCTDYAALQLAAHGAGLSTTSSYALAADEVVFSDWCAIYRNYWADIGMSFTFQPPSDAVRGKDAALKACVAAGGRAAKPGAKSSEVFKAMCDALAEGGIHDNEPQGHGIGLDVREYPIIVPDRGGRIADECIDVSADLSLEENMVINLEIGHFLPGVGAIQNEQSYIVRPGGGELLIPYTRRSPVLIH